MKPMWQLITALGTECQLPVIPKLSQSLYWAMVQFCMSANMGNNVITYMYRRKHIHACISLSLSLLLRAYLSLSHIYIHMYGGFYFALPTKDMYWSVILLDMCAIGVKPRCSFSGSPQVSPSWRMSSISAVPELHTRWTSPYILSLLICTCIYIHVYIHVHM